MRKRIVLIAIVFVMTVGGISAYLLLNRSQSSEPTKTTATEAAPVADPKQHSVMDVDFIKKVLIYHQQVIEMADIALQKSASSDVRKLAQDIKIVREADITKFKAWLAEWNELYMNLADFPQQSGHDMYPTMPGMATPEELQKLRMLSGVELERTYLEMMKAYYDGMTESTQNGDQDLQFGELVELAKNLETVQGKEIVILDELLKL